MRSLIDFVWLLLAIFPGLKGQLHAILSVLTGLKSWVSPPKKSGAPFLVSFFEKGRWLRTVMLRTGSASLMPICMYTYVSLYIYIYYIYAYSIEVYRGRS